MRRLSGLRSCGASAIVLVSLAFVAAGCERPQVGGSCAHPEDVLYEDAAYGTGLWCLTPVEAAQTGPIYVNETASTSLSNGTALMFPPVANKVRIYWTLTEDLDFSEQVTFSADVGGYGRQGTSYAIGASSPGYVTSHYFDVPVEAGIMEPGATIELRDARWEQTQGSHDVVSLPRDATLTVWHPWNQSNAAMLTATPACSESFPGNLEIRHDRAVQLGGFDGFEVDSADYSGRSLADWPETLVVTTAGEYRYRGLDLHLMPLESWQSLQITETMLAEC